MHGIPGLYYANTKERGRGVFCLEEINEGDIIEICPVIILQQKDIKVLHQTHLHDYYFIWDQKDKTGAIVLGYGSLYNHSSHPNARFEQDLSNGTMDFICLEKIKSGEEILIDYHAGMKNDAGLWFHVN